VELGYALSALYPATVPVYRGVGYELAGVQRLLTLPAADVRTLAGHGPYVDVRRPRADQDGDAERVRDLISGLHASNRDAGPIEYRASEWQEELEDAEYFTYLAADGFVGYGFEDGNKRLRVSHLVGGSEATLRSLWALVGSGSSIATHVRVAVAPGDPLFWLLPDLHIAEEHAHWWMLRALDPAAAIGGRGFPPGVDVTATIRLTDHELPASAGDWQLHVADGVGALERTDAGSDALELSANGFAALYAGWPLATLRRTGRARGADPAADALLDAAFIARPYMLDYF
jgi:predicted acetyltransferase